jgi:serine protease AprX
MPLYRVFCPQEERDRLPPGLTVEESYPAFVVVSADEPTVDAIRRLFPVEELPPAVQSGSAAGGAGAAAIAAGTAAGTSGSQDVVVRFRAPVRPEWVRQIEQLGASLQQPLGDSAFVVEARNSKTVDAIRALPVVEQVDVHVPDIRISPDFVAGLGATSNDATLASAADRVASGAAPAPPPGAPSVPGNVVAIFLTEQDRDRARRRLRRARVGPIHDAGPTALVVTLSGAADPVAALEAIVAQPGLRAVEEQKVRRPHNNVARAIIGLGVVRVNPTATTLTGAGETVCVADTGLDTGDPLTLHADFKGRLEHIRSFPIAPSFGFIVTNPGGDDGPADIYSGHGTHTAGSVLGNGARSRTLGLAPIQGMAPAARLVFQAIEQTPNWTARARLGFLQRGTRPPASGLFGIPDDLEVLLRAAYDRGARIHSNSWGGGDPGAYDVQSEAIDRFVWNHRDLLVVVAAGNDGQQTARSRPAIAAGSVTPPGTAKNCLTVGASENNRPGEFPTEKYGTWWPDDFPAAPIADDRMADTPEDIVAFSSRGPNAAGRRMPDLIAPGTFILSTRSSQIPANNFGWSSFPPAKKDYMFLGGTSMATPLVAGAAALVRQHLRTAKGIARPSAALVKAALIHSTRYLRYRFAAEDSGRWADNEQGWGLVTLKSVLAAPSPAKVLFVDERAGGLTTGSMATSTVTLTGSSVPLRVTLAYSDFPGDRLVNNLNLVVTAPNGRFFVGNDFGGTGAPDRLNNVEGVLVERPDKGRWSIRVVASEVLHGPQPFALVISGVGATLS